MPASPATAASPATEIRTISESRRAALKVSYTVRALDTVRPTHLVTGPDVRPRHGDIVLATVTQLGKHTRLESPMGRRAHLFPGDEVLVAYGARYAPDQFEAETPDALRPCHLVAAGGIAAEVVTAHAEIASATMIDPQGLVADANGTPVNLADLAHPSPEVAPRSATRPSAWPEVPRPLRTVPTLAVVGTSMNAGKTTTGATLVRGLTAAGYRVGAAKITGTGAGGDRWMFQDAGAVETLDFTDAGLATTYRVPTERILAAARALHARLIGAGADVVVLEVADGVLQPETSELLFRDGLPALVDGWIFAAADSAGALYGCDRLLTAGLPVLAVSGRLTSSPLATREATQLLDAPVYGLTDLADPAVAMTLATGPVMGAVQEWSA